jgi:hypothetical protein
MGQINRIPLGYLGMLGTKTGGKNPFVSAEQVNPVVEMTPFYHAQGLSIETGSLTFVNVLEFVDLTVPSDEAWFVYAVSVQSGFTLVGDRLGVIFSLFSTPAGPPNNSMVIGQSGLLELVGAIGTVGEAVQFPNPLPIVGGSKLRCTVTDSNVGKTLLFSALVAKFKA